MFDDLGNVICEKCLKILMIGDFPFCRGDGQHSQQSAAITQDGIPGGIICENYGPHPIRFDSHSERRRYMESHGLREKETFCPTPGTDIDPQGIPNPAGFADPQTLANAAALICRNGQSSDFDAVESGVMRNLTAETVADAQRVHDAVD